MTSLTLPVSPFPMMFAFGDSRLKHRGTQGNQRSVLPALKRVLDNGLREWNLKHGTLARFWLLVSWAEWTVWMRNGSRINRSGI